MVDRKKGIGDRAENGESGCRKEAHIRYAWKSYMFSANLSIRLQSMNGVVVYTSRYVFHPRILISLSLPLFLLWHRRMGKNSNSTSFSLQAHPCRISSPFLLQAYPRHGDAESIPRLISLLLPSTLKRYSLAYSWSKI